MNKGERKETEKKTDKKNGDKKNTEDPKNGNNIAKIGISVAASAAVGAAAWFGLKNKNVTIVGALATLLMGFVIQKQ
jgi:hypothetical protein